MTKENRERLYKHYVEVGYTEAAEDMLSKHPELAEILKEPKPEKEIKSKGKK